MNERWADQAKGIGWVAMQAAKLEYILGEAVILLAGTDRVEPLVHGSGWESMRNALKALVDDRLAEIRASDGHDDIAVLAPMLERLLRAVTDANQLMIERAHVVHAIWSDREDPDFTTMQFRRWGRHRLGSWTPEQLDALGDRLGNVSVAVYAERNAIAGYLSDAGTD